MYDIIHFRHLGQPDDGFVTIATGLATLAEARDRREVSGDVVVHTGTFQVVKSDEWLWDWEKVKTTDSYHNGQSYAARAIL